MESKGATGVAMAKDIGMSYATISRYINLIDSPLDRSGNVKESAQKICVYFNRSIDEVWSLEQLTPIESNTRDLEFSYHELTRLENISDPILSLENDQLKENIHFTLDTKLKPKEVEILKLRFGFEGDPLTLEQVGDIVGVTRERVRQIEAKALRKLRHPSRSNRLRTCIGYDEVDLFREEDHEKSALEKVKDNLAYLEYRKNKEVVDED